MPVDSLHPDYDKYSSDWVTCRHAYEGQKAIKRAGVKYLPRLGGQTESDYAAYKERALFYGITATIVSALTGMVMGRNPVLTYDAKMERYFQDGVHLNFFEIYQKLLLEVLLIGRFGILLDRPRDGGDITLAPYTAENIINWRTDDNGTLSMVVLREYVLVEDSADIFEMKREIQYRVLRLVDGIYTVQIWNGVKQLLQTITPNLAGHPIDYIPFFILAPSGMNWSVEKSPMIDIVDINISHYRSSADLEHGRHWTGLPTPVVTGVSDDLPMKIGSQTAWVLPNEKARAFMLEFTGQGLQSLEKAIVEKQFQLASMSSRLLDNSVRGSEDGDVVQMRHMSETATLISIVRVCESYLNAVYETIAVLNSYDPSTINIRLNKEFLNSRLSGQELKELFDGFVKGTLSAEALVYNLRRGDVLPIDLDDNAEVTRLTKSQLTEGSK